MAVATEPKPRFKRMPTSELINRIFAVCELLMPVIIGKDGEAHQGFYPYQAQFAKRAIRSVLENDGDEITALFARQSGKSETVASVVAGLMIILPTLANMPMFANDPRLIGFRNGFWVGIFAPIRDQAQITFNRIRSRLASQGAQQLFEELAEAGYPITYDSNNGVNVVLSNGSRVTCRSASDGSNIEGESFMMIICEECQDISSYKIRKSIHPMGAAYNATIIKIGTPTTYKGDFYEAIERNKKAYEEGKLKYRNHFEYNYKTVMKYNPKYAKYIMKEIYRLGEDSDEFQMAYNLKWILERSMFVSGEFLEKHIYNNELGRVYQDHKNVHVAGIDFGKSKDSTVVTVVEVDWENPIVVEPPKSLENLVNVDAVNYGYTAYKVTVKDWLELQGDNYEEQYPEIIDFLSQFNLARVVADATGAGAPIVDRLAANLECEVVPFAFSLPAKSDMYKHLNAELRGKRIVIPADEETRKTIEWREFDRQMQELQKTYSGSHMVVSHPNERGAHDDYPDSLALAVWGSRTEGLGNVEAKSSNPFYSRDTATSSFYRARNRYTARRR